MAWRAAVLAAACVVTACTSGGAGAGSSGAPQDASSAPSAASAASASANRTVPAGSAASGSGASGPVGSGPTAVATAASCPWMTQAFVADTIGMRQGRVTVLRSGGHLVGCRFYALQHPNDQCDETCLRNEHLPGPTQPVVEISRSTYASPTAAHNAFVLAARAGTQASAITVRAGVTGVSYRTRVYPKDGARDWACGWSVGTTRWLVRLAEDESSQESVAVAHQVTRAG